MRQLSFLIFGILLPLVILAQKSPHGEKLLIDCAVCHTTGNWKVNSLTSTFDHSKTAFDLQGQHQQIDCKMCHLSLSFLDEKGQNECASCHLDVHQNTLGNNCAMCHTSKSWVIEDVNEIHFNSRFPLIGAHANADCFDCHLSDNLLQFRPLGVECFDCHKAEYLATTTPNHQSAGYSTECFDCHTMQISSWSSGDAEHGFFPLIEGHAIADCYICHAVGSFQTLSPNCESCHLPDYNSTLNPPHAPLNLSVNCLECHTTLPGWTPASFDVHNDFYILEGAHAHISAECESCHTSGYANTPNTCYGCHSDDYTNANDPVHLSSNFPTDCTECHTQNAWQPSTFSHIATFPLTNGHLVADCFACHIQGNYETTSPDCESCHLTDYNTTLNPPHASLSFPVDCMQCHTTMPGWTPVSFDIHNDFYVLEGAHALIATECASCHTSGYVNTPNTCYGCHADEYNTTNDPNHLVANFPTDCTSCHSQNAWNPSTFDHDSQYFPIYGGDHQGEWNSCTDCHTVNSNYEVFSCIDCHEHNKTDMDDEHSSVGGYIYNSINCYTCHPIGKNE
jgi:hypothetical protein